MSSSVFATLRRKRDRTKGAAANGTVLVPDTKKEPIFNSTPNLHKINLAVKPPSSAYKKKESHVYYPEESDDTFVEIDNAERYGGFGSRRSSSAAETNASGGHGSKSSHMHMHNNNNKGSSGSLRHFASMLSMFGSLKRTKSSRKMAYGSTQDFEVEKRETAEFMRTRAVGRSPDPETKPAKSSTTINLQITDSTDSLCDRAGSKDMLANTEPGVRSSSSSSLDDDSRRSSVTESLKAVPSESTESEPNFEYTVTKSEEELKRTKIMIQGIKKFNIDPKKGIEFLVQNDILQNTSDDVAKFLKFGEGLSKTAIGKYLGEHVDFNEEVLQAFLDLHNFTDLHLVNALREFLWSFRLPGESQKIDRMMEAFAKRYCVLNPGIFSCTDTCYLLSYSIIMLNTTLHNPSVRDKPSVEQFIQMNRDVDCGKSLNKAFLVQLFNSILTEPFKIPPEDANDLVLTFFNPNIEGWLWKQGGYKTWKRRWFILSNNCLYYFKFTTDKSPRGIIPLENVNAKEITGSKSNELFPFILFKRSSSAMSSDVIKTCKTLSNGSTVLSQYHTITVASINPEDRKKWVNSINQNNSSSDFYDVLTLKKRNLEAARHHQTKGKRADVQVTLTSHSHTSADTPVPRRVIRKSLISQPSTAPGFEYKDRLPPELMVPSPNKDPNNYFRNHPVFSSSASISSGGVGEPDSSYGSFSDISRSRSESRIVDYAHEGSISSIEHDTGSLGSGGGTVGLEDRLIRGCVAVADTKASVETENVSQDMRHDLPKKLSVIEESQNFSDRSSSSSGANVVDEVSHVDPISQGYRKLREECESETDMFKGATSSDRTNCDTRSPKLSIPLKQNVVGDTNRTNVTCHAENGAETDELSSNVQRRGDIRDNNVLTVTSITLDYSRSKSVESDV